MKIYLVEGIRHHAVEFAATPQDAVLQAEAQQDVGDWEVPEAYEIALPEGYALNPARQNVEWFAQVLESAWDALYGRLDTLTEAEFFWEPVPNCWTVHQAESGRWIIDYALPEPNPAPFTTIAWRLVHVAACKAMYYEYGFGAGKRTWDTLEIPHTVADTLAWLETGHAKLLVALSGLDDADLLEARPTNWGALWPTWRIFWAMIAHDLEHGAEVGCLRDLYRANLIKE